MSLSISTLMPHNLRKCKAKTSTRKLDSGRQKGLEDNIVQHCNKKYARHGNRKIKYSNKLWRGRTSQGSFCSILSQARFCCLPANVPVFILCWIADAPYQPKAADPAIHLVPLNCCVIFPQLLHLYPLPTQPSPLSSAAFPTRTTVGFTVEL